MPFLTLDGVEVPVEYEAAGVRRQHIGSKRRSYDGSLYTHTRGFKRVWRLETSWIPDPESDNLERFMTEYLGPLVPGASAEAPFLRMLGDIVPGEIAPGILVRITETENAGITKGSDAVVWQVYRKLAFEIEEA